VTVGLLPSNLDVPTPHPVTDVHVPQRPLWYCRECWQDWPCAVVVPALKRQVAGQPTATRLYLVGQFLAAFGDLGGGDDVYGPALWRRIVELREPGGEP
jgi:hypothetical protein